LLIKSQTHTINISQSIAEHNKNLNLKMTKISKPKYFKLKGVKSTLQGHLVSIMQAYKKIARNIGTLTALVIICIITGFLVYEFIELNDNSLISSRIHIINSKNSLLEELSVRIYHDDKFNANGDLMVIGGKITKLDIANSKDNIIVVSVNRNLKLEESNLTVINKGLDYANVNYFLNFKDQRNIIYLRFIGDIFNRRNPEINNVFYCELDFGTKPDTFIYPKTSFSITGLYNYYNINSYPDAFIRKSNLLELNYDRPTPKRDNTIFKNEGIWVSAEHKQRKYNNQTKSYLITTIIGIMISVVMQLIFDFFKRKE
jgi:hypothetical protein